MKYLTDIDLSKNELQNARIQNLAADPANGVVGQIYYNTTDKIMYQFDGTNWKPVGRQGTVTSITAGTGLSGGTITDTGTISHADTSSQGNITALSRRYINSVTLDDFGHVTALGTGTETVVNTDRYVNSAAFTDDTVSNVNNVKMTLTRAGSDTATITANIPQVSTTSAGVLPKNASANQSSTAVGSSNYVWDATQGKYAKLPANAFSDTTYTFADGTNGFTVTPSGGSAQTVTVTPSITNNVTYTGSLTANHIVTWSDNSGVAKDSSKVFSTSAPDSSSTDSQIPTAKAVWTAIDNLPEPMVFKGTVGTGGTTTWANLPSAAASNEGWTYKVITAHATTVSSPTGNPSTSGYYELVNSRYVPSTDTSVQSGKTYYTDAANVGDTIISNATKWEIIPSGDEPSGTVTNIATGSGLTGGPITSTGTISHADTSSQASVTALSRRYINSVTLDGFGHVTELGTATETVIDGVTSVTAGTGLSGGTITSTGTISHASPSSTTAHTYYKVNVDSLGHVNGGNTSLSTSDLPNTIVYTNTNQIITGEKVFQDVPIYLQYNEDQGDISIQADYSINATSNGLQLRGPVGNEIILSGIAYPNNEYDAANKGYVTNLVNSVTVGGAVFADDTTNNESKPVKLTITDADTTTIFATANISKVSSSDAGVLPKYAGTAIHSADNIVASTDYLWDATTGDYRKLPSTMTPSSHTHGNIQNGGTITSDTTIATGDKLVITDASGSNKVARSSLAFDTATTGTDAIYLSKKGTWESPASTVANGEAKPVSAGAVYTYVQGLVSGSVYKQTETNTALTASGGAFTWTISNTLGNADVSVNVYYIGTTTPTISNGDKVIPEINIGQSSPYDITITINDPDGAGTLAADTYRAVIMG